jgi:hypothetical protein
MSFSSILVAIVMRRQAAFALCWIWLGGSLFCRFRTLASLVRYGFWLGKRWVCFTELLLWSRCCWDMRSFSSRLMYTTLLMGFGHETSNLYLSFSRHYRRRHPILRDGRKRLCAQCKGSVYATHSLYEASFSSTGSFMIRSQTPTRWLISRVT